MPKLISLNLATLKSMNMSEMTLVIPFAALEPIGEKLPLNTFQTVTETIADAVSDDDELLVAPMISIPYATPMQGFRGVISVRRKVFMNQLADIVLSAINWGVKRVLFLDGTIFAKQSIDQAMKRYKRALPEDFTYGIISWQSDQGLKRSLSNVDSLVERWRTEAGAAVLYREITGNSIPESVLPNNNISEKQFEQWRRRGRDPERLVKYFPNAHMSSWNNLTSEEPILPSLIDSIKETIDKGFIFHGV